MRGNYNFKDEKEHQHWIDTIQKAIDYLINNQNIIDDVDLSQADIGPYQLHHLLEQDLGYERTTTDMNGWEQDTWYHFYNEEKDIALCVFSCGITFEMKIMLNERRIGEDDDY